MEQLFFNCEFSRAVWEKTKGMAMLKGDWINWHDIILKYSNGQNGNNIWGVVRRLILVASVYCIWNERNSRIFKEECKSHEDVGKLIIDNVKWKLLSLKVKDSNAVREVERLWSIRFNKKVDV